MYEKVIMLFHRDLRIEDNAALNEALKLSKQVIPVFILDPKQIEPHPYRSTPALQFMLDSLKELDEELKKKNSNLYLFKGRAEDILKAIDAQAIFYNKDYTPFARKRDEKLDNLFKTHAFHDALLTYPGQVLKQDQTPYTVYTAFYNRAKIFPISKPHTQKGKFYNEKIAHQLPISDLDKIEIQKNNFVRGARSLAKKKLHEFETHRDDLTRQTNQLSPHHKFGTISIRETYYAVRKQYPADHQLIKELYWRDFFTHIAYHFPHVFGNPFRKKYENLSWVNNQEHFKAWCQGKTGFPVVDAAMRELNETGFMHNRARMIVASFLTKDLHIDWRLGEKYFAKHLVDYDPAVNNGNWQWAASTGCDAQPYFRIFNPWLQQKRFDPECIYIKKWVQELKDVGVKAIHNAHKQQILGYPKPLVDHSLESPIAKQMYKSLA